MLSDAPPAMATSHWQLRSCWLARTTATSDVEQAVWTATLGPRRPRFVGSPGGHEVLVGAKEELERSQWLGAGGGPAQQIVGTADSREDADEPRVGPRVATCILQRCEGALEPHPLLRIGALGLVRAHSEERGVESVVLGKDAAGAHVRGIPGGGRGDAGGDQLLWREAGDAVTTVA